jgi:hypothetical protein
LNFLHFVRGTRVRAWNFLAVEYRKNIMRGAMKNTVTGGSDPVS